MLIGEDVTVLAQDDARSLAFDIGFVLLRHVTEEKLEGGTLKLLALAVLLIVAALGLRLRGRLVLGGDDDDRRAGLIGDPLERAFEVSGEIDVAVDAGVAALSAKHAGIEAAKMRENPMVNHRAAGELLREYFWSICMPFDPRHTGTFNPCCLSCNWYATITARNIAENI